MKAELTKEVLEERIEELKADIKEFTIMELEATTEKSKIRYDILLSQTKDTLMVTIEGLKYVENYIEMKQELKDLMGTDDFEDIVKMVLKDL
ncbi:hypothetical protein ACN077_20855 [Clostridium chromiireducens]|uniref:hypothetical protein n=1 Tax=Clostridium chromiireducens TaxID=225345 RepID=UPI003AF8A556